METVVLEACIPCAAQMRGTSTGTLESIFLYSSTKCCGIAVLARGGGVNGEGAKTNKARRRVEWLAGGRRDAKDRWSIFWRRVCIGAFGSDKFPCVSFEEGRAKAIVWSLVPRAASDRRHFLFAPGSDQTGTMGLSGVRQANLFEQSMRRSECGVRVSPQSTTCC